MRVDGPSERIKMQDIMARAIGSYLFAVSENNVRIENPTRNTEYLPRQEYWSHGRSDYLAEMLQDSTTQNPPTEFWAAAPVQTLSRENSPIRGTRLHENICSRASLVSRLSPA